MQTIFRFMAKKFSFILAIILPALLVTYVLWLPFGFRLGGLVEEWSVLALFSNNGPDYFLTPPSAHALRPFMFLPLAIAYALDATSFYYWHLLTIISLIIKGIAASSLIWVATRSRFFSALTGILILLYPADTMQLPLRPLQINWAVALLLLGSVIFLIAYHTKSRAVSISSALIAPILILSAMFMYETTCMLIMLPFMILFVREGLINTVKGCRKQFPLIFLWFSSILAYLIYCAIISPKTTSYQSQLLGGRQLIEALVSSWPKLFSIGVFRSLLGGWFDALRMTLKEFSLNGYIYITVVSISLVALLTYLRKKDDEAKDLKTQHSLRLIVVGFLLLCLGYAPFLVSPSHLAISQRTFLFATPGATIFYIGFLIFLSQKINWLGRNLAYCLIVIGLGAQLFQFQHYSQISEKQRTLFKNIIENFDGNLQGKKLLLLDEGNQLDRVWMLLKANLQGGLSFFYNQPMNAFVEICYQPSNEWRASDNLGRMGSCIENKDGWIFRSATATPVSGPGYQMGAQLPDIKWNKNEIVTLRIKPDGTITEQPTLANYRQTLKLNNNLSAKRYRHILTDRPYFFNVDLFAKPHLERYQWQFGDWWSMELPFRGSGWRDAEWKVNYFYNKASAWKIKEASTLLFDLKPLPTPYKLRGQFDIILSQAIQDGMQIKINHTPLTIHWKKEGKFKADIPQATLVSGVNVIEFFSPIDLHYYGLSAKLSWYKITPKKHKR